MNCSLFLRFGQMELCRLVVPTDWDSLMGQLTSTFLRGLGVVLPLALTAWILVWFVAGTENLLRPIFTFIIPEEYYLPGLGLVLGILVVYATGVLVQLFVIKRIWEALERLLERIPLVKTGYAALTDFFDFFSRSRTDNAAKVVSVDVGGGARLIGFVTDDTPRAFTASDATEDRIAVYMPMSYQIGGYTLLVRRDKVTELDLGVEEAMRMVLTAGIGGRD